MITRKNDLTLAFFLLLSLSLCEAQNAKSYDTNDWIPIPQPDGTHVIQKKATGRVLTLPDAPQQTFFPEEYRNIRQAQYEQYLRETPSANRQRPIQKQQEKPQQQKPFTPQQLEQYYINQRKQLAKAQLQQQLHAPERKVPLQQLQTFADGQINPQLYQQSLLKQVYPNLPQEYLIPPQSIQQNYFPQQYIYPSDSDSELPNSALRQTGPVQFNNPEIKQVIQQPPTANGTVDFYNALNLGFQNGNQQNYRQVELTSTPPINKDNIQLVYVPLEQLQQSNQPVLRESVKQVQQQPQENYHQQQQQRVQHQNVQRQQPHTSTFHGQQHLLKDIQNDFIQQALQAHKLQEQFEQGGSNYQVSTQQPTRKPVQKKRKPHQPPLAVYMTGQNNAKVTDVLYALKDAKSINVQDTVGPDSPDVFVGPANLDPPSGFSKFELPYLSSLESNRVERKVDQLPFFVAPLNYKAPPGYAKIPFPSPHVGTVVVNMNDLDSIVKGQGRESINQGQRVSSSPASIHLENVEDNVSKRPARVRSRPHYRGRPEQIERTTENVVEIQQKPREHIRGGAISSTFAPQYLEPITQHEQLNQNVYYTSVTPEQYRDYQSQNYNQVNVSPSTTKQPTQQPYEFIEVKNDEQSNQGHNVGRSSTRAPAPKQKGKGGLEFDIVHSVGSTLSPYDEKKHSNFFAQFENLSKATTPQVTETTPDHKYEEYIPRVNIAQEGLQPHHVEDVYSIIPQVNREKLLEEEVTKQKTRQYLPLDGQRKQKEQVNYDHLFQLPFITNAEVNQINTAARPRLQEEDETNKEVSTGEKLRDDKYVVFEEYPVRHNTTKPVSDDRPAYNERHNSVSNTGEQSKENPIGHLLFPGLINDLEDPSIRQLLTPILLAPTERTRYTTTGAPESQADISHPHSSTELIYSYSEEPSSTTSAPTTTAPATYKLRTRGRGNSRFNDRTTTQSSRRNLGRRTQHPSRTRQTTSTTEYSIDKVEYTTASPPRRVSTKQRFRTRGKPHISEGYSTTTSNSYTSTTPSITTPEVEDEEYAVYPSTKSYTEETVKKPQLITRAKILSPEEEYLINKYNLAYTIAQDPKTDKVSVEILTDREKQDSISASDVIQSQSTPRYQTQKEAVVQDVQQQTTQHYQVPTESSESTIIYPHERDYSTVHRSVHRSSTTTRPVRIKTRIRGRPKTTTQAPTSTAKTVSSSTPAEPNEFYGFFRSPSFRQSSSEEFESAKGEYLDSLGSSTKHQTGEDEDDGDIKLFVNEVRSTPRPVQFVGELLPKYSTSTEQYYEVTSEKSVPVTEKFVLTTTPEDYTTTTKKRQRGRGPTRRTTMHTTQSYEDSSNEVQVTNEELHRPTQRTRTRGRAHFKSPDKITTETNPNNDNYPQLYLAAKENQEKYTPQTSVFPDSQTEAFRITVDPELIPDDDQELHASNIRPKIVLPEHNHFTDTRKEVTYTNERGVQLNETHYPANPPNVNVIDLSHIPLTVETTEEVEASEPKKGYWKLVKSKKINDEFEAAESQNIGVVRQNSLDDVKAIKEENKVPSLDSIFNELSTTDDTKFEEESPFLTTEQYQTVTPTNEVTTIPDDNAEDGHEIVTRQDIELSTEPSNNVFNMKNIETSTSTTIEISQKAVICTRGVCVNSPDIDMM